MESKKEDQKESKKEDRKKIDSDNDDDEEEISTSCCPYKQATSFFSNFFSKNKQSSPKTKNINLSSDDKPKCPFGYTSKNNFSPYYNIPNNKCPYGFENSDEEKAIPKKKNKNSEEENEKTKIDSEDEDSGDEIPKGGCPVMNNYRKDPQNKDFDPTYEVPLYGAYDFLFFLRGGLSDEEFLEKTEKIRKMPRHLKYTIFYQNKDTLKDIHKEIFPKVFFLYDEIKQKGIRYYNRKKFRECLECMNYAYGLMKWIEFKDPKKEKNFLVKPSLDGILDEDIVEKEVYMDAPDGQKESYEACVIYVLEIMAYCHMELRHYNSAIECLDECEKIAGDRVPDIFLRRAQARMYNKNSDDNEIKKAKEDMEKAIKLGEEYNADIKKEYDATHPIYYRMIDLKIYYKTKKKLDKIIDDRINENVFVIRRIIGKIRDKGNENLSEMEANLFESFCFSRDRELLRYFKVLKEMKKNYKLAIKFFLESQNQENLDFLYKDFELFQETYQRYKMFYKFNINSIDPKALNRLNEEEKKMLQEESKMQMYQRRRAHILEDIYSHGIYNIELFRYSFDQVLEEERKQMEAEEKEKELLKPKFSLDQFLLSIGKGKFGVYLSVIFVVFTLGVIGAQFFNISSAGK